MPADFGINDYMFNLFPAKRTRLLDTYASDIYLLIKLSAEKQTIC